MLLGVVLNHLASWENQFATANLLLFGGAAVWLGSYAALVAIALPLAATIARIVMEERHLRANLPGYIDYTSRVRGRLIPLLL